MEVSLFYITFILLKLYIKSINILNTKDNNLCEKWKDFMKYIKCYPYIEYESLLDLEPIDVVIKYIDLSDKELVREGIPQIKKDLDNGEIKFSLRSILKNIPWINKIFIVMPNEKVKSLKNHEEIKEKIIYVKDKDLAGFDSASSTIFEFILWKLKKFGLTDNFIYFNDDCFVGNPLKKSDFFYVENGKVVPYIFGFKIKKEINRFIIEQEYEKLYNIVSQRETLIQDGIEYYLQIARTRLFIYKLFGDSAKIVENIHNALPDNIIEGEELYNIVLNKYEKPEACLKVLIRDRDQLIYQELRINYILNKYNRKIKVLNTQYFDLKNKPIKVDLFVINKGAKHYKDSELKRSFILMNEIFPVPSKYEQPDNIANGLYIIETKLKANIVLKIGYNKNKKENSLYLGKRYDKYSEVFYIEHQNDNSYLIKSIFNTFLGVSNRISKKSFNLSLYSNIKDDNQKWYILSNNNYYFIVSKNQCSISVSKKKKKKISILNVFPQMVVTTKYLN